MRAARPLSEPERSSLSLALAQLSRGEVPAARATLTRLFQRRPDVPEVHVALADVAMTQRQIESALFHLDRADELSPGRGAILLRRARTNAALRRMDDARRDYVACQGLGPADPTPWTEWGSLLQAQGRLVEAIEQFERGCAAFPDDTLAMFELATGWHRAGEPARALEVVDAGLARFPHTLDLSMLRPFLMNYVEGLGAAEVASAHRRFGEILSLQHADEASRERVELAARARGGPLVVGFVTRDAYRHSVAYFFEPILERLDRARFRTIVYAVGPRRDETTARLEGSAGAWRALAGASDDQIARRVRSDGVDVLVDLSGITAGHRLGVFARRAAPVQVTYLGYPNTTGLREMDARLVDSTTDPAEGPASDAGSSCVEGLVRLDPCFVCYRPAGDAPEPGRTPERPVTLGCFGALAKVGDGVLRAWGRVLARVPGAVLLLKNPALADERVGERVRERLARCGCEAARVELRGPTRDEASHLSAYRDVDVALDTFPYAGTTTTCEALWMGVPVVTLAGRAHAGRVGVSLLSAAGLDALVARDEEEYVEIAAARARAGPLSEQARRQQRGRMAGSVLCDAAAFAERFGGALEGLVGARGRTRA